MSQASQGITSSARLLTKAPSREAGQAVPEAETETRSSCQGRRRGARPTSPHRPTTGPGSLASPLARLYPPAQPRESTALGCVFEPTECFSCIHIALVHGGSDLGTNPDPQACIPGNWPYLQMVKVGANACREDLPNLVCPHCKKHTVPSLLPHVLLPLLPLNQGPHPFPCVSPPSDYGLLGERGTCWASLEL